MTLWAMRAAVLGKGPWLLIRNEENLDRLRNSPRKRRLVTHDLNEQITLFEVFEVGPYLNAYTTSPPLPCPPPRAVHLVRGSLVFLPHATISARLSGPGESVLLVSLVAPLQAFACCRSALRRLLHPLRRAWRRVSWRPFWLGGRQPEKVFTWFRALSPGGNTPRPSWPPSSGGPAIQETLIGITPEMTDSNWSLPGGAWSSTGTTCTSRNDQYINRSLPGRFGASPVYPGRFTASRERSGRQAFPPVTALRLSVAQNPLSYASHSSSLITRNDRYIQSVTSGAVGASPVYPGRFTASRERLGRQAFPPVIALRLSVAQNP
jgi:hypothetical protein